MAILKKAINKIKYGESIVIVSGLPRSGTSMLMNMISTGGMEILTDNKREADEDNLMGYYEFELVKDLYKTEDKTWLEQTRGKCVKVISWLLKDLPENYHYKVVFSLREIDEIIASQNKMLARRDEETISPEKHEKMKEDYEKHLRKVKIDLREKPNFDVLYVNYTDVISNPLVEAGKINKFLDGKLNQEKMAGVVDSNLYRNRKS